MKKLLLLGLLVVTAGVNCCYGQSRGIMYEYAGVSNTTSLQFDNIFNSTFINGFHNSGQAYSTTYEIGNDIVITHTPFVKLGNNYFSLLTKYDKQLCPIETKKIPIPPFISASNNNSLFFPVSNSSIFNIAINGTSKSDGGFALISRSYPHILRNYNNQGNLIFSKIISTPFYDIGGAGTFPAPYGDVTMPKVLANPDNNNLYVIFNSNFNAGYPIDNGEASPNINVIEISPSGNFVNSFRLQIPFYQTYTDIITSPDPILHRFNLGGHDFISDVKYVKGGNGPSSDRIWIGLRFYYQDSLELNGNMQPGYVNASYFGGNRYMSGVAVMDPQGTLGDVNIMLSSAQNSTFAYDTQLALIKNGTVAPEILLLTGEGSKPIVYQFRSYTSPIPSDKYRFPFTVPTNNYFNSHHLDIKNHQKNILFSMGKYFGIFNLGTLNIDVREQDINNAQQIGHVDFMTKDTNKLYINYSNYYNTSATAYNPLNFIIKEDIRYFNTTCWSKPVGNYTAGTLTPSYYPLVSELLPLPGIILTNDLSYVETPETNTVRFKNICLNCSSVFRSSDTSIENPENLDIILHPNPSKNYFELTTELTVEKVEVYSMLGQLVKTFEAQNQYTISDLSKGSYIVKIATNEGVSNKNLIVE
jgi:hypothetical protein